MYKTILLVLHIDQHNWFSQQLLVYTLGNWETEMNATSQRPQKTQEMAPSISQWSTLLWVTEIMVRPVCCLEGIFQWCYSDWRGLERQLTISRLLKYCHNERLVHYFHITPEKQRWNQVIEVLAQKFHGYLDLVQPGSPGFCDSSTDHTAQQFCKEPTFLHQMFPCHSLLVWQIS